MLTNFDTMITTSFIPQTTAIPYYNPDPITTAKIILSPIVTTQYTLLAQVKFTNFPFVSPDPFPFYKTNLNVYKNITNQEVVIIYPEKVILFGSDEDSWCSFIAL